MKSLGILILATSLLSASLSCSQISTAAADNSNIVLVATTPGDAEVKAMLGIAPDIPVEMLRWDLTLSPAKTFSLKLKYGMTQPNTRGFAEEHLLSLEGKYEIENDNSSGTVYHLKSEKPAASIALVKLNEDLFHVLSADKKLMTGNGGWSYTLNRKTPSGRASLPLLTPPAEDKTAQVVFHGRTPCAELARQFQIDAPEGCFKLKWKLTLNRNPKTFAPTTYILNRTHHRQTVLEGKWASEKRDGRVFYELDPDKPEMTTSFVMAGENALLFLDKNGRPYVGSEEFSYTLDRRIQQ
jgi:hypothetical protein